MTTAFHNNIMGYRAANAGVLTGGYNNIFGREAGNNMTTGAYNNIMGYRAANAGNITGDGYNNIFGAWTGSSLTSGAYNNIFGMETGMQLTTGNFNNIMGYRAAYAGIMTGEYNNIFGVRAGYDMADGDYNNIMGYEAGYKLTTGSYNNIMGYKAAYGGIMIGNGYNNIFGREAGYKLTTGKHNNIFGYQAGYNITTGDHNNILGEGAGVAIDGGAYNNIMGFQAAYNGNMTGDGYNVIIGYKAAFDITSGQYNTLLGYQAGAEINSGFYNDAIGYEAGKGNTTGNYNVSMGYQAGYKYTALNNTICIGKGATVDGDNMCRIGNDSMKVGIGTSSPGAKLEIVGPNTSAANTNPLLRLMPSAVGNEDNYIGLFMGVSTTANWGYSLSTQREGSTGDLKGFHIKKHRGDAAGETLMLIDKDGNVGIGHTSPPKKLTVKTGTNFDGILLYNENNHKLIGIERSGIATYGYISLYDGVAAGTTRIHFHNNHHSYINVPSYNFGIGINVPEEKLDVSGNIKTTGYISRATTNSGFLRGVAAASDAHTKPIFCMSGWEPEETDLASMYGIGWANGSSASFIAGSGSGYGMYVAGSGTVKWWLGAVNSYFTGGHFGIGTSSPTYKLHVNGHFRATNFYDGTTLPTTLDASANGNIYVGRATGNNNDALSNIGIGYGVLDNVTTAYGNIGIGRYNLTDLTTGSSNIAIGGVVLANTTTGDRNIGIGNGVLDKNISGYNSIGIGVNALRNATGHNNIGMGYSALDDCTSGVENVSIGNYSSSKLTDTNYNVAVGYSALELYNSSYNTAVGYKALEGASGSTGESNTAIGFQSIKNGVNGGYNTAVGFKSLESLTTGSNNTAIGYEAGKTNPVGAQNTICIGNGANVTGDNMCRIGNASIKVGIGTSSPEAKLHVVGDTVVTGDITAYYSDERLKTFKGKITEPLAKIKQLNGYYFVENELAKSLGYDNDKLQVGVSAQEVEKVLPEIVTKAPIDNEYKTVWYQKLTPLLIEGMKEQQTLIEQQQTQIQSLQEQIDELKELIKNI